MDEKHYWIGLNMVVGVGKTLFHRLWQQFGSVKNVFSTSQKGLMSVGGIGEKTASEISSFDLQREVERELRLAEKYSAKIVTLESPDYPQLLKEIFDPPPVLYYQGEKIDSFPLSIAVVGTRIASSYGKLAAEKISGSLAEKGICIVSGMARGIDTIAHRSALKSGGKTLAVLGCGLSHTYPPENVQMRKMIVEKGAVISEFPLLMKPDRANFPARNRVISGLTLGTVVIEAGEKSGALITAQFAVDQGREVFALPGNIYSAKSMGTNQLIKNGAKLVDGPEAILEELPSYIQDFQVEQANPPFLFSELTEKERGLMQLLSLEEKHIDSLIETSRLSPAEVSATLIQLELKGLVQQREGKRFIANYH